MICLILVSWYIYTKYSTLPRGILYIEPKVGMFSEAEGREKYSLPRVQYMPIFHKEGFNILQVPSGMGFGVLPSSS